MVTLVTILQVNLVMSILLYVMVLTYLYTIQATNMDSSFQGQQQQQQPPSPDPLNSLIIKLLQADLTRGRTGSRGAGRTAAESTFESSQDALLPSLGMMSAGSLMSFEEQQQADPEEVRGAATGLALSAAGTGAHQPAAAGGVTMLNSDLLRQHKRYNSPRVVLSDRPPLQPPPLYLMDDFVSAAEVGGNKTRKKRYANEHKSYRGEYSVCDSESEWVTDKTQATDLKGQHVTVLRQIRSSSNMQEAKQYFYETRCRTEPFKSSCRGIDDKHWNSQCKTVQTYVRALTQVRNAVGWRWIRIDTSCVCALSRKHRRT